MRKKLYCTIAALAIIVTYPALAQDNSSGAATSTKVTDETKEPGSPQVFVNEAAVSNMFEIQSSELALDKTDNKEVHAFAQQMVEDHTKAGKGLKQAAAAEKISDVPTSLDDKHQKMIDKLKGLKGEEFTKQYVQMQLQGHKSAVALFSSYKDHSGKLGEFAAKTLPTLQEHLDKIQKLAKQA